MPRAPAQRPVDDDCKLKKIPRPPNAWILYRTDSLHEWRASRSPNAAPVKQADISRLIASKWKNEPDHVKLDYEKRAAIAKAEHKKKYPDYKYNPIPKEVKDKMRAEEREAKKKAREEAKAAKLAGGRASYGSRRNSSSPQPSTSNVKLEAFEAEELKPITISEPLNRGCGPSPPIDYYPDYSSTSSGTPLLSSSSLESVRNSPFPSSSSLPPPTPLDASDAWHHPSSQPPPAYPSHLVHSPMPSRHSSYNLLTPSFVSQSLASTPSDSPPSYTEGSEGWPSQSTLGFQPFAPVPEFQGDWSEVPQGSPLHQPEVQYAFDNILPPRQDVELLNVDATSVESIYNIAANHSAQSPPGELDLGSLLQHFAVGNDLLPGSTTSDDNYFATMLDMAELHETIEDHADDAGVVMPDGSVPFCLEDFAAWVNTNPPAAIALADPNFYLGLSAGVVSQYPHLNGLSQPSPFYPGSSPTQPSFWLGAPVLSESVSTPACDIDSAQATYNMFNVVVQQEPEIAMPVPTVPVTVPDPALLPFTSSQIRTEFVPSTPAQKDMASTPVEGVPSPAPGRYVPPSGAARGPRRVFGGAGQWLPGLHNFAGGSGST